MGQKGWLHSFLRCSSIFFPYLLQGQSEYPQLTSGQKERLSLCQNRRTNKFIIIAYSASFQFPSLRECRVILKVLSTSVSGNYSFSNSFFFFSGQSIHLAHAVTFEILLCLCPPFHSNSHFPNSGHHCLLLGLLKVPILATLQLVFPLQSKLSSSY